MKKISILITLIILILLPLVFAISDFAYNRLYPIGLESPVYGSVFGNEIGDVIIGSSMVYFNVTNTTAGILKGFTFNESGVGGLTAQFPGVYQIESGWSFSGGPNTEYHLSVSKNGIKADNCHAQRKIGPGGDVGSASTAPCLVFVNVGDVLHLSIENIENTVDAKIHDIGMIVIRVGNL